MQVLQLTTTGENEFTLQSKYLKKKNMIIVDLFCTTFYNLFIPDLLLRSPQPIGQAYFLPRPMDLSALRHFPIKATQQRLSFSTFLYLSLPYTTILEQPNPNIVTEEVKTKVIKTKYGKGQGFISRVGQI